jgi:transcriptional regulator with XRE-family HTH domain
LEIGGLQKMVNTRVNEIRQEFGLTQKQFAERIAISVSYLAGMELGNKNVNDRIIRLISTEFNISEHWLKTGIGSMYNEIVDLNLANLTSLFKSLSPDFQECALSQLMTLVELDKSCNNTRL